MTVTAKGKKLNSAELSDIIEKNRGNSSYRYRPCHTIRYGTHMVEKNGSSL
jgi:hypothetical protein